MRKKCSVFGLVIAFGVMAASNSSTAQALGGEAKVCAQLHKSHQYKQAFPRCLKAASEGDAVSSLALAELYENGRGVTQSKELAHAWYLRAAKLRNPIGQFRVAQMYRDGIGVKADAVRAKLWFAQAKANGFKEQ